MATESLQIKAAEVSRAEMRKFLRGTPESIPVHFFAQAIRDPYLKKTLSEVLQARVRGIDALAGNSQTSDSLIRALEKRGEIEGYEVSRIYQSILEPYISGSANETDLTNDEIENKWQVWTDFFTVSSRTSKTLHEYIREAKGVPVEAKLSGTAGDTGAQQEATEMVMPAASESIKEQSTDGVPDVVDAVESQEETEVQALQKYLDSLASQKKAHTSKNPVPTPSADSEKKTGWWDKDFRDAHLGIKGVSVETEKQKMEPLILTPEQRVYDETVLVSDDEATPLSSYVEPDVDVLQSQEEWRQVSAEKTGDAKMESLESTAMLLGMHLPRAGVQDANGMPTEDAGAMISAISFREGINFAKQYDSELAANPLTGELLQKLANVPKTGLTAEEIAEVQSLAERINVPENPIRKRIEAAAMVRQEENKKTLQEKLPALVEKKPTSGRAWFKNITKAVALGLFANAATPTKMGDGSGFEQGPTIEQSSVASLGTSGVSDESSNIRMASEEKYFINKTPPRRPFITYSPKDTLTNVVPSESPAGGLYAPTSPTIEAIIEPTEESLDSKSPSVENALEKQPVEFTFVAGDKIDTVSEALFETWKKRPEILGVTVTKNQFLALMYKTIALIETKPLENTEVFQAMKIVSGDFDKVQVGQTIVLNPLLERMALHV